ncbi:sporulation protein [Paenibacillus sp. NEAU-GSW1]|uniref:sporulation protein n=1 Tax=Paenibacillus sp. NEAU-GSW1 TaxID=2682486 RepID=UPI0012E18A19|nr:sporulation protein [Paenibacillus sp. NEAU-GSW1]MUT65392.1 sporulation protein SpoOM [Paenibacillus sp. NEAU-GSW1]
MSMFKKMLASVGIGAAKVDLLINDSSIAAGDYVSGVVRIEGGRVNQEVDDVYAFIKTRYIREHNDTKVHHDAVIAKYLLAGKFTVEAGRVYEFPVSFQIPVNTPATINRTPVWIQTGLDIKDAADPGDQDYLQVSPHPHSEIVLEAVEQLGFTLREVTCEYAPRLGQGLPFVQEFEFVPRGQFRGELDELEIIFHPSEHGLELLIQIDRKVRGLSSFFSEMMETDESLVHYTLEKADLQQGASAIARDLSNLIRRYV